MAWGSAPPDGSGERRAVRWRALSLALGGRPQNNRQPLVRTTLLRAEISPYGAPLWNGFAQPQPTLNVGRIGLRAVDRDRSVTHGAHRSASVSGGSRRAVYDRRRAAFPIRSPPQQACGRDCRGRWPIQVVALVRSRARIHHAGPCQGGRLRSPVGRRAQLEPQPRLFVRSRARRFASPVPCPPNGPDQGSGDIIAIAPPALGRPLHIQCLTTFVERLASERTARRFGLSAFAIAPPLIA
jgi:hypothetical protein